MAQHSHVHKNVVQAACVLIAPCAHRATKADGALGAGRSAVYTQQGIETVLRPADGFNKRNLFIFLRFTMVDGWLRWLD